MSLTCRWVHVWYYVADCQRWETGRCCSWRQAERSRTWPIFPHSNHSLNSRAWTGTMRVYRIAGSVVASPALSRLARDWVEAASIMKCCTAGGTVASSTCGKISVCSALWHILLCSHTLLIHFLLRLLFLPALFFYVFYLLIILVKLLLLLLLLPTVLQLLLY